LHTGWKVDCIIKKARPFSDSEFTRRQEVEIAGVTVNVASAEDTILAELEWSKDSRSAVQHSDVTACCQPSKDGSTTPISTNRQASSA